MLSKSNARCVFSLAKLTAPRRKIGPTKPQELWPGHQTALKKALPNIGRESHTFLYHIVDCYDRLATVTIFLQGDMYNVGGPAPAHTKLAPLEIRNEALRIQVGQCLTLGDRRRRFVDWDGIPWTTCLNHTEWLKKRGGFHGILPADLTPGEFWAKHVGDPPPSVVYYTEGAMFAVRAETIRHRPKGFYQRLLDLFEELDHSNPEYGHYMERFWYAFLSADFVERDPSERREEDRSVVVCKMSECTAHAEV